MTERELVDKGNEFSIGDVVRLKAGGPTMTIEEIEHRTTESDPGKYIATCVWYSSKGDTLRATFDESMLEVATAQ